MCHGGESTQKLEEHMLMEECSFFVASHLDEVEDHSFGMIYYDKLDLRDH